MVFARKAVLAARRKAHGAFDPIWEEGHLSRVRAYAWLAEAMEIPAAECHFALFDVGMCEAAELLSRRKLRELRRARKRLRKACRQGQGGLLNER